MPRSSRTCSRSTLTLGACSGSIAQPSSARKASTTALPTKPLAPTTAILVNTLAVLSLGPQGAGFEGRRCHALPEAGAIRPMHGSHRDRRQNCRWPPSAPTSSVANLGDENGRVSSAEDRRYRKLPTSTSQYSTQESGD